WRGSPVLKFGDRGSITTRYTVPSWPPGNSTASSRSVHALITPTHENQGGYRDDCLPFIPVNDSPTTVGGWMTTPTRPSRHWVGAFIPKTLKTTTSHRMNSTTARSFPLTMTLSVVTPLNTRQQREPVRKCPWWGTVTASA